MTGTRSIRFPDTMATRQRILLWWALNPDREVMVGEMMQRVSRGQSGVSAVLGDLATENVLERRRAPASLNPGRIVPYLYALTPGGREAAARALKVWERAHGSAGTE